MHIAMKFDECTAIEIDGEKVLVTSLNMVAKPDSPWNGHAIYDKELLLDLISRAKEYKILNEEDFNSVNARKKYNARGVQNKSGIIGVSISEEIHDGLPRCKIRSYWSDGKKYHTKNFVIGRKRTMDQAIVAAVWTRAFHLGLDPAQLLVEGGYEYLLPLLSSVELYL